MTRVLLAGLLLAPAARGQAVAVPAGAKGAVIQETVVVIWDAPAGVEHLIRSATVEGSADAAGLLLATPARPELAPTAGGAFVAALQRATEPRVERRWRLARPGGYPPPDKPPPAPPGPLGPVPALPAERPAGAVLAPGAVGGWLGADGFAGRPALAAWLDDRTAGGDTVTAVRVGIDPATPPALRTGWHRPVRMTFPTARPVVPLLPPADAAAVAPGGSRRLNVTRVYLLADARYDPAFGPAPAPWQVTWAGPADRSAVEYTAAACGLPAAEAARLAARDWVLTEVQDQSPAGGVAGDLTFVPTANQSPHEKTPHVVYEDILWPYWAAAGGLVVLGPLAVWACWRLTRVLVRGLPAAPLD